ncbi:MAG: SCO family protein [Ilumatobacteraceae bacterium]
MSVRTVAVALMTVLLLGACGDGPREMAGYQRDPAPNVADVTLPDLSNGGEPFSLRSDPGSLLVIYFGYTNCPDFCPTTLSDVRLAEQMLDDPGLVDVAMVTVDPERDLPILADYVGGFFDDGHALGTNDPATLAAAAAPFGVSYAVSTGDDGQAEVAHTTALYAVDDTGSVVLTWPFGTTKDDLAADMQQLLEDGS